MTRRCLFLAVVFLFSLLAGTPASAQLLQRPVAMRRARILTMDGRAIENGTLLIAGTKIRAVGSEVKLPLLARTVDVTGTTITPGLIDASSSLGRGPTQETAAASPTRRAEDAFDRYDTANIVAALRQGVTAIFLAPRGPNGVCGTGAVIRLTRDRSGNGAYGSVLKSQAALCIDLASNAKPVTRLKTLAAVRKAFKDAVLYRRNLEDYEEDLAEYTKKLEDQAKKKPAAKKKPTSAQAEGNEPEKKEPAKKTAAKAGEPKKKQKPRRPKRNAGAELILRALDRKIPVRITAYRSSDILNALELADEFSLDFVLDGATEAHLVKDQIAKARTRLVLGRMDLPGLRRNDLFRRAIRDPGTVLDNIGVPWTVGSGAGPANRARFIAFNVQLAAPPTAARGPLRRITADAADIMNVNRRIGRLRPGMLADFVVWSGDPLDPRTKVLRVYVGGVQVFAADAKQ